MKLSISIVTMNNLENLKKCINSLIFELSNLDYEILVVAYLFSEENKIKIKDLSFPIKVIFNDQFAGFAENHNLAFGQAKGEYILVLNDDTYFQKGSFERFFNNAQNINKLGLISPSVLFPSGRIQYGGKPKYSIFYHLLIELKLGWIVDKYSKYVGDKDLLRTYSVTGAVFLIKHSVLKELGFFNEYYFFIPEDIELSEKAIKAGYENYVDFNSIVYHLHSATASSIFEIIHPVSRLGLIHFYGTNSIYKFLTQLMFFFIGFIKTIFWFIAFRRPKREHMLLANINLMKYIFKRITPKDLFIKLYTK